MGYTTVAEQWLVTGDSIVQLQDLFRSDNHRLVWNQIKQLVLGLGNTITRLDLGKDHGKTITWVT